MELLTNTIIFFGKVIKVDPVAFTIGSKEVYWYGIIIAMGFCLAIVYAMYEAKRVGLSGDCISDIVLVGTPAAIVGARLYYVIFNWGEYAKNPKEIIAIWNGGLAIYGGIIAGCLAAYFYCRHKKISFLEIADVGCGSLLIGQLVGRWGNFINCEAYGRETRLPWRMGIIEGSDFAYVHPTFLYESLWNLLGLIILQFIKKKKKNHGELFYFYITWYGMGRAWIEGLRTDSLYLGPVRISQLVALLCVVVGISLFVLERKNNEEH